MWKTTSSLSILLFFLVLATPGFSQDCYNRYLKEGIAAYEALDFETAIKKFNAAKICPDRMGRLAAEEWIIKTKEEQYNVLVRAKKLSDSLLEKAEGQAEANRLLALAMQNQETSAHLSFHLLRMSLQADPSLVLARDLLVEVIEKGNFFTWQADFGFHSQVTFSPNGEHLMVWNTGEFRNAEAQLLSKEGMLMHSFASNLFVFSQDNSGVWIMDSVYLEKPLLSKWDFNTENFSVRIPIEIEDNFYYGSQIAVGAEGENIAIWNLKYGYILGKNGKYKYDLSLTKGEFYDCYEEELYFGFHPDLPYLILSGCANVFAWDLKGKIIENHQRILCSTPNPWVVTEEGRANPKYHLRKIGEKDKPLELLGMHPTFLNDVEAQSLVTATAIHFAESRFNYAPHGDPRYIQEGALVFGDLSGRIISWSDFMLDSYSEGIGLTSVLQGHDDKIISLKIVEREGDLMLLSGSEDGFVKIWVFDTENFFAPHKLYNSIYCGRYLTSFDYHGEKVATIDGGGSLKLWNLEPGLAHDWPRGWQDWPVDKLLEKSAELRVPPLTLAEKKRFQIR